MKMGFLDRLAFVMGYTTRRSARRAYAAALQGRLTADWVAGATSIDQDIRMGLVPVRARARDLSQNNEYVRAYLRAVKKNVVGADGFKLQVKSVDYVNKQPVPDQVANGILEDAFAEWGQPATCTVGGRVSFRKLEELAVETVARDGELFVRLVRNRGLNRFAFTLQPIEPDWIDEKLNGEHRNGNLIRMGVELDEWRRPVAYHVSRRNKSAELWGAQIASGPHDRIPATDMIHVYDPERVDQTRGISWLAPVMLPLHDLKGYTEAAIINARSGANKMGFFSDPDDTEGSYDGEERDSLGRKIIGSEPGTFQDIGNRKFTPYDPKYPDAEFDGFVKSIIRSIASGLGVSYSSLSNDLTEVNFSSIRAGLLEERETWKSLQAWFVEFFLNRVFAEWLYMALLAGAVNLPDRKYAKFNAPRWTGRRWGWVDPLKEVLATKEAIAAGLKSATRAISEDGGDIEDTYQELKAEKELAEKNGLTLDYGGKSDGAKIATEGGDQDGAAVPGDGKGKGSDGRARLLV